MQLLQLRVVALPAGLAQLALSSTGPLFANAACVARRKSSRANQNKRATLMDGINSCACLSAMLWQVSPRLLSRCSATTNLARLPASPVLVRVGLPTMIDRAVRERQIDIVWDACYVYIYRFIQAAYTETKAVARLLERDEAGGVCCAQAGAAVQRGLVRDAELAQVLPDHFRLDLNDIEHLA